MMRSLRSCSRSPSPKPPRGDKKEELTNFNLHDLYMWFQSSDKNYPKHVAMCLRSFVYLCNKDEADRFAYIVNVNSQSTPHWIVARKSYTADMSKAKVELFDPLSRKLTGPLVSQLRKINDYQVESKSLNWQDNDWECGFFALWLILMMELHDFKEPEKCPIMPDAFREICQEKIKDLERKEPFLGREWSIECLCYMKNKDMKKLLDLLQRLQRMQPRD